MTDPDFPLFPARDGKLTPQGIADRSFSTAKRGYAESEVRAFLRRVADEVGGLTSRERDLEYRVAQLEEAANQPPPPLSDQQLIVALGEETARVLGQAREAAIELRNKADEHARRVVREAQENSRELRAAAQQALELKTREAEDAARARASEIVGEARALRERVLGDLGDRRQELERQIAELRSGRGKLVEAYELVERSLGEVTQLMAQETQSRVPPPTPAPEEREVEAGALGGDEEPPPASASDGVDVVVDTPEPEVADHGSAPADAGEDESNDGESKDVSALFEQLRSEAATPGAGASDAAALGFAVSVQPDELAKPDELVVVGAPEEEIGEVKAATGDEALLDARHDALAEAQEDLARRAKRALQDEQNDILDGVRRQRGKIDTGKVLPPLDDQLARWAHVLQPAIDRAYAVGAATAGGNAERAPAPVLAELSSVVVTPLRDRLASTLAAIDEPTPADTEIAIAQRLGARYREWRSQHLETTLGDALAAAHAQGVYDAAPAGARLRWVPSQMGKCPDCDDNALEPTVRGNDFPTGQPHPPAHPGCRCLIMIDSDG